MEESEASRNDLHQSISESTLKFKENSLSLQSQCKQLNDDNKFLHETILSQKFENSKLINENSILKEENILLKNEVDKFQLSPNDNL